MFLDLQKSLLVSFQGCWTQWQRFESSSIHHFWDTALHFLKTHFCLESGFLLLLELQKSPQYQSWDAMHTSTQNMADEPTLVDGPPHYQSRDDLHTSTQNLADEPTLADGPPSTRAEMQWIPVHKTWQMNLPWSMDPTMLPEQRCLAYHYTKLGRWTYFGRWTP